MCSAASSPSSASPIHFCRRGCTLFRWLEICCASRLRQRCIASRSSDVEQTHIVRISLGKLLSLIGVVEHVVEQNRTTLNLVQLLGRLRLVVGLLLWLLLER